jgi:hypothetical protein
MSPVPALADVASQVREQSNDSLERISLATATSHELATLGDRLVGVFIDEARSSGCTWADIGGHLGVSKQAAQKRYASQWASLSVEDLETSGLLSRCTDRVKTVLRVADQEARHRSHSEVQTEHLVFGILADEDCLAYRSLAVCSIAGALRSAVETDLETVSQNGGTNPTLDLQARRALEHALREALKLGHNYIGTEHLLLALARGEGETLEQTMAAHHVDFDRLSQTVVDLLAEYLKTR